MKSKIGTTSSLERELTRIAKALIESRETGCITDRPSSLKQHFTLAEAYETYRIINSMLIDKCYTPIGRKLGFTNPETWNEFDLSAPIWAFMYDKTIDLSSSSDINVQGLVAPRIEPEVVLKLNDKIEDYPENGTDISQTVEWVAIGLEIVDSHYSNWKFNAPDVVADFGAHSKLIVGQPVEPNYNQRIELDELTKDISVQLFKNSTLIDIGRGKNALGGPLRALVFLIEELKRLPWNVPLKAGEIVTTGTLTKIPFIKKNEEWKVKVEGLNLSPVTIKIV